MTSRASRASSAHLTAAVPSSGSLRATGSAGALRNEVEAPGIPRTVGTYRVVVPLSLGSVTHVYLALSEVGGALGKLHAVKRLRPEYAQDPVARSTFLEEANLAARFRHPGLASAFEVGEDQEGVPFVVMDYLEGISLERLARAARSQGAAISHAMWARIVAHALAALHHAHEMADYDGTPLEVVHRDVNPETVLVGFGGHVSVVDFGVARPSARLSHSDVTILKGKIGYMAPEHLDDGSVDRRADVFSMGVVLWEMLTGRRLASYSSATGAPHYLTNRPVPRVRDIVPEVHQGLDAIVARACERNPEDRFASAKEMQEALHLYLCVMPPVSDADVAEQVLRFAGGERERLRQAIGRLTRPITGPRVAAKAPPAEESGERLIADATQPARSSSSGLEVLGPPSSLSPTAFPSSEGAPGGPRPLGNAAPTPSRTEAVLLAVGATAVLVAVAVSAFVAFAH